MGKPIQSKEHNTRRKVQVDKIIEKPKKNTNKKQQQKKENKEKEEEDQNENQSDGNISHELQEEEKSKQSVQEDLPLRRSSRQTRKPLTEKEKLEQKLRQQKILEERKRKIQIFVNQFKKEHNLYTKAELEEIKKQQEEQNQNQQKENDEQKNEAGEEEIEEEKLPQQTLKRVYSQGLQNQFFNQQQKQDGEEEKEKENKIKKQNKKQQQQKSKEIHIVNGRVGLRNLGNTCYQNSVIQFLSNIQPLSDYCSKELYKKEINLENNMGSHGLIATAFTNLINEIWSTESNVVVADEFHKIISHVKPMFGNYTQEDAQEFLIFLLDYLHEDLNRVIKKPFVEEKEYTENLNQKEQEKLAADTWRDYLLRNKSVIIDLFQGQLKNSITCQKCKFSKYKFEPFMYLSLPLDEQKRNSRVKVTECLQKFLNEEQLSGDEQWFCPKCNIKVDAIKKIDLWKMPNVLMIMFKRFKYDGFGKKIDSCLEFQSQNLLLKDFVPQELQKEQPTYDLISALCHKGTLSYGHYYSYAKNKENFEWYEYNDSKTKCIQNPEKQIAGSSVYMLMYQKVTNQLIRQQSITDPNNWPHKKY